MHVTYGDLAPESGWDDLTKPSFQVTVSSDGKSLKTEILTLPNEDKADALRTAADQLSALVEILRADADSL